MIGFSFSPSRRLTLPRSAINSLSTSCRTPRGPSTVMLKEQLAVLPSASVALTATVVVPMGNVLPEAGVLVRATAPAQLSVAVGANVTSAPVGFVNSTVIGAGQLSCGGLLSTTVTVCAQAA